MAYADVTDVEVRLQRTLSETEQACASQLLDGASAMLDKLVKLDGSDEQLELLQFVCSSMVARAMPSDMSFYGASQMSITAGAYTQQGTYSAPVGDLYLTKTEKRILGVTAGYIGTVEPLINGYWGSND